MKILSVYQHKSMIKKGGFPGSHPLVAQLGKCMSDQDIRDYARSVIRSRGGQCDSSALFEEMFTVGVTSHQFQLAIKNDYEIEVSKGIARLIEK